MTDEIEVKVRRNASQGEASVVGPGSIAWVVDRGAHEHRASDLDTSIGACDLAAMSAALLVERTPLRRRSHAQGEREGTANQRTREAQRKLLE